MDFENPEYQQGFPEPPPPKPPSELERRAQAVATFVRQHAFKIFLVLLAAALIISAVISALTPILPEAVPTPLNPISSGVADSPAGVRVSFQNPDPDLPEKLPLYQTVSQVQSSEQLIANLASQMAIPKDPSPYSNNIWTNFATSEQLLLHPQSGKITYLAGETDNPEFLSETPETEEGNNSNEPFNVDEAIRVAEEFIGQLPSFSGLTVQRSNIAYLADEGELETSVGAEVISIPFVFNLSNYPVYFSGERDAYITVQVNKNYQVNKADFYPPPPNTQMVSEKNIISLTEAGELIAAGKATVIAAGSSTGIFDVAAADSLRITNTQLEYRLSLESQLIIPYFRFEAEGTGANQSAQTPPINLTLILPAIPATEPNDLN